MLGGSAMNDHSRTPASPAAAAIAQPAIAIGRSCSSDQTSAPATRVASRPSVTSEAR